MRKSLVALLSVAAVAFGGLAFSPAVGAQDDDCQTMNGDGPFTVFAPTNAAFEALPAGTLDSLLADPSGALTDVLQLHVIAGEVNSEAAIAAAGTNVETLGGPVAVALEGESLTVGGATVVQTDIVACNGIVHVIDAVITEPAAAAPAAAEEETTEAMPMPNRVDTGDSGLAASSGISGLFVALLAGVAVLGLGTSSFALARARRQS